MTTPLLLAQNLVKTYTVQRDWRSSLHFNAVDDVSLSLERRETLAIVGESGCGKSTVGSMLLQLQRPDKGRILIDGEDTMSLDREGLRRFRRRVQVVFQDPYGSLDPRERVRDVLVRPMLLHKICTKAQAFARASSLMESVGLSAAQLNLFPHQFSGGQRQRIAIARALCLEPDVIVCDEPVSALDVSVQAQVVNLLQDLQRTVGVALVFISHDLAVVKHLAKNVAVMYSGRIVEQAPTSTLFDHPSHPYTRALLAAAPSVGAQKKKQLLLSDDAPDPTARSAGCKFAGRCSYVVDQCHREAPPLATVGKDHLSACFLAKSLPSTKSDRESVVETPALRRLAAFRRARDNQPLNAEYEK